MSKAHGWERHWEIIDRVGRPEYAPDPKLLTDVMFRAGVAPPHLIDPTATTLPATDLSTHHTRSGASRVAAQPAHWPGPRGANGVGGNSESSRGPPGHAGLGSGTGSRSGSPSGVPVGANSWTSGGLQRRRPATAGPPGLQRQRLRPGLTRQPLNRTPQPRNASRAGVYQQYVQEHQQYEQYDDARTDLYDMEQDDAPYGGMGPPGNEGSWEQQERPAPPVPKLQLGILHRQGSRGGNGGGLTDNGMLASMQHPDPGLLLSAVGPERGGHGHAGEDHGSEEDSARGIIRGLSVVGGRAVSFRMPLPPMPGDHPAGAAAAAANGTGVGGKEGGAAAGPSPRMPPGAGVMLPGPRASSPAAFGFPGAPVQQYQGQGGAESHGWSAQHHQQVQPQHQQQQQQQQPLSARPRSARTRPTGSSTARGEPGASARASGGPGLPPRPSLTGDVTHSGSGQGVAGTGSMGMHPGGVVYVPSVPPKHRYRGILERLGRLAAHRGAKGRRRARRLSRGMGGQAGGDSPDTDSDDASPEATPRSTLGGWSSQWRGNIAKHANAAAAAAAATMGPQSRAARRRYGAGLQQGQQQQQVAVVPPGLSAEEEAAEEAAARGLGREEQAVWALARALEELTRFSRQAAVRGPAVGDGSVLDQVDAQIAALQHHQKAGGMGPDGRHRALLLPPPPPAFPAAAARAYLAAARQGVGGLEGLEAVVGAMRRKLQGVVGQEGGDLRQAALDALQAMEMGMGTDPAAAGAADAAGAPLSLSLAPGPQRAHQWGHRLSSETGSEPATPQLVLGGGAMAGVPSLPPWSTGQQHVTVSPAATARRPSSPTGHRPGSPTNRRPGSPTNRRPGSPTGHCPGSPTNRRPGSPTGRAGVTESGLGAQHGGPGGGGGGAGHKAGARSLKVSFSKVDRQPRGGQGASDSEESEDGETPRDAAGNDGRSSKEAGNAASAPAAAAAAAAAATGAGQAPTGPRPNSARGPAGGADNLGTAERGGGDGGGGHLSARLSSRPSPSPTAHQPQPPVASPPTTEASNTCPPSPTSAYVPYITSASGAVPYGSARNSMAAAAAGGGGVTARGTGQASGPTLSSAAGLDRAWTQLEALMIQLHDSHVARGDLVSAMEQKAGEGTTSGTAGGGGGAGSRAGTVGGGQGAGGGKGSTAGSLAVLGGAGAGVEGSGPGGSARGSKSAVDRLVTLMNATLELGAGGEGGEGGEAGQGGGGVGRRGSVDPAAAAGALRAAVVGALQPKHTEQVLYYLAKLALMLQNDPHLPPDAGFLLSAGLDLLLGEVSWLLALLRVGTGPSSPHLAALSALLTAYEGQRAHAAALEAAGERLALAVEDAMDRATYAEKQLEAVHATLRSAGHDVSDLTVYAKELEKEVARLKARNEVLEDTITEFEGDLGAVEAAHGRRAELLAAGQHVADTWRAATLAEVESRSVEVQVASEGDAADPRALPPALAATRHAFYPITPTASFARSLDAEAAAEAAVKGGKGGKGAGGNGRGSPSPVRRSVGQLLPSQR